jgi:transposase-like protein
MNKDKYFKDNNNPLCNWCNKLKDAPKTINQDDLQIMIDFVGNKNKLAKFLGVDHKTVLNWNKNTVTEIHYSKAVKLYSLMNIIKETEQKLKELAND